MHATPHSSLRDNRFEILNETVIVLLSILYYGLTEMVHSGKERANVGMCFVGIILFITFINTLNFFGSVLNRLYLLGEYWWNRLMQKLGNEEDYTYLRPHELERIRMEMMENKKREIVKANIEKFDQSKEQGPKKDSFRKKERNTTTEERKHS